MEDGRKMTCDRCRSSVPISDIQYLPRGKDAKIALCSNCRKEPALKEKEKSKEMTKESFFCARCKYKFKFDVFGVTSLKCPYCGKGDKVTSGTIKSADALLHANDDGF